MYKYRCIECGEIFDEPETFAGDKVEFWGAPCTMDACGCPACHGDFEEVYRCELCDEWYTEDELSEGICDDCLHSYDYEFESVLDFTRDEDETIRINGFLASMFTRDEIEALLIKELRETARLTGNPINCTDYIEEDKGYFAGLILDSLKRGE